MYQTTYPPPTKLLKAPEVAVILNCSKAFVYKLIKQRKLPSVQIGYSIRVKPEDLNRFIRENTSDYQV
jgi:excisionase family DNA binding protein